MSGTLVKAHSAEQSEVLSFSVTASVDISATTGLPRAVSIVSVTPPLRAGSWTASWAPTKHDREILTVTGEDKAPITTDVLL
jgi:hypothetical protein